MNSGELYVEVARLIQAFENIDPESQRVFVEEFGYFVTRLGERLKGLPLP